MIKKHASAILNKVPVPHWTGLPSWCAVDLSPLSAMVVAPLASQSYPLQVGSRQVATVVQQQLKLQQSAYKVHDEPARAIPWGDGKLIQPAQWKADFHTPQHSWSAEYWVGNRFVSVKQQDVKERFADPETMKVTTQHGKIAAYFNVDNGTGAIRGIYLQGNEAVAPVFEAWMKPFNNIGMTTTTIRRRPLRRALATTAAAGVAAAGFALLPGAPAKSTPASRSYTSLSVRRCRARVITVPVSGRPGASSGGSTCPQLCLHSTKK